MLTSIKNQFLLDFLYENLSNSDKNNSIFAKSDKISFFLIFYTQKLQNYLTSLFKSLSVSSDLLWKLPPPPPFPLQQSCEGTTGNSSNNNNCSLLRTTAVIWTPQRSSPSWRPRPTSSRRLCRSGTQLLNIFIQRAKINHAYNHNGVGIIKCPDFSADQ